METFKLPIPESDFGDGHLTMIDPALQHVDWANVAFATGKAGGAWHIDLATNTWTRVTYPSGSPAAQAYDVVADSKNSMYGMQMNNDKIWITDGKTLQTVWYDFPTKGAGCRRGHVDSQDRLWCGVFNGNRLAMFDPKTRKITEWKAPTPWTRPYDAQFDDKTYVLDGWNGQRFCGPAEYPDRRCRSRELSPACGWATSTATPSSVWSHWPRNRGAIA